MDGLIYLALPGIVSQFLVGNLVDFGVLTTALAMAVFSALILMRQLLVAILLGE